MFRITKKDVEDVAVAVTANVVTAVGNTINECKPRDVSLQSTYGIVDETFQIKKPVFGYSFVMERQAMIVEDKIANPTPKASAPSRRLK